MISCRMYRIRPHGYEKEGGYWSEERLWSWRQASAAECWCAVLKAMN